MKIINIVMVLLVAFILASCAPATKAIPTERVIPTITIAPRAEKESGHEVGKAMDGIYAVYLGSNSTLAGYLKLNQGQYSFTSQSDLELNVPTTISSHFFFIQYPQGIYQTEYYGSIKTNSLLEDLHDDEILVTISFDEAGVETRASNYIDHTFLIRNNKKEMGLYFHSIVSEIQQWRIVKSWK